MSLLTPEQESATFNIGGGLLADRLRHVTTLLSDLGGDEYVASIDGSTDVETYGQAGKVWRKTQLPRLKVTVGRC